jgi:mannose-6-phosphate isomerase-like protein (cupin superfamily)
MGANVVEKSKGKFIPLKGINVWVIEDGSRTRNELSMAECEVSPSSFNPPPHIHHAHEEIFYILEGELEFNIDGKPQRLKTGDSVTVPIGVAHTFSNPTEAPARFLNTYSPARYVFYFDELAELVKSGTLNQQTITALMARYETEVVGH